MIFHHAPPPITNVRAPMMAVKRKVLFFRRMMEKGLLGQGSGIQVFNYFFKRFERVWRKKARRVGESSEDRGPFSMKVEFLKWVQQKLKKARCYFKKLTVLERQILELCIYLARKGWAKFRSPLLLMVIGGILKKVAPFLRSFTEQMMDEGKPMAEEISRVACSWGNKEAMKWRDDPSFAYYWGLLKSNIPMVIGGG